MEYKYEKAMNLSGYKQSNICDEMLENREEYAYLWRKYRPVSQTFDTR